MSSPNSLRRLSDDFFSNVPDNVIEEILDRLPILAAARTSVLSKQWRRNWLSLKRLEFDKGFMKAQSAELVPGSNICQKCSHAINDILLHHDGPVHEFILNLPHRSNKYDMNHSQWLSFLSRNNVKKIIFNNFWSTCYSDRISSYIFSCTDLVHLQLGGGGFIINYPPAGFEGFPNLKRLELVNIRFSQPGVFSSLIANSRQLTLLRLQGWAGMLHVVVDVSTLQSFTVIGVFESLQFGNIIGLKTLCIELRKQLCTRGDISNPEITVNAVHNLVQSCELETIQFNHQFVQILDPAGSITNSPLLAFNHVTKLCLRDMYLDDSVFNAILQIIYKCPLLKELDISVTLGKDVQSKPRFNELYRLHHLIKVKITLGSGSTAELTLIECLLTFSEVLEELCVKCHGLSKKSELKVYKALTGFRRTSPTGRLD